MDLNSDYTIEAIGEIAEDFEKISVLTIMYMSKISRLKCYEVSIAFKFFIIKLQNINLQ